MSSLAAVSLIINDNYFHFVYRCAFPQPSAFGNVLLRDVARVLREDFNNDLDALAAHVRKSYAEYCRPRGNSTDREALQSWVDAAAATASITGPKPKRLRTLSFRAIIDRTVAPMAVPASWQYVIDLDAMLFNIMDRPKMPLEAVTRGAVYTLDDDRDPDPDVVFPLDRATEPPPAAETLAGPPRWDTNPVWETVAVPPAAEVRRMLGYTVPETTDVFAVAISDGTDHAFIPVAPYMTWNNVMLRARRALYQMESFGRRVLMRYKVRAGLFSATPRLAYQGRGARIIDMGSTAPGAPFEALVPGAVLYATVVYLADHDVWWAPFGREGPCCAQCGVEAGPDRRLKACSGCRAVYYCDAACQRAHWREGGHKKACKCAAV